MRRPSCSLERLIGSGARNFAIAASASPSETPASLASPGMDAPTYPSLSAKASMVTHMTFVSQLSHQMVLVTIEESSFAYVSAMCEILAHGDWHVHHFC